MTLPVPKVESVAASVPTNPWWSAAFLWNRKSTVIAAMALLGIGSHLALRYGFRVAPTVYRAPLLFVLVIGGLPLLYELLGKLRKLEFGSDILGGISIVTSVLLGEYLAGAIIVLMLAGGEAWNGTPFAVRLPRSPLLPSAFPALPTGESPRKSRMSP